MKIVGETSRHLIAFCDIHDDKRTPNVKINKGGRWPGHWRCFACGAKGKISIEEVKKMSKKKSICRKRVAIDWESLTKKFQVGDLTERKSQRLAKEWKVNSLPYYGIGWTGDSYSFPMYDSDKNIVGIMRRFPDGKKLCIHGSQLGLFIPDCVHPQVVVNEGLSSSAVATELGYFGIGLPSASFGEKIISNFLRFRLTNLNEYVIIVQDGDDAGIKSRIRLQAELWRHGMTNIKVVSPYKSDLRDYYMMYGRKATINLLEN